MVLIKYSKKLENLLSNTADLSLKRKARRILEELNVQPKDRILEVGCGDGYYLAIINQLESCFLAGLDIDVNGLNTAERNLKSLGIKYKRLKSWKPTDKKGNYLMEGNAQRLPFRSNFFDKVIMSEVAEHLPNDIKGISETYRVLKNKGILLLTVPNKYYPILWDPVNWLLEHLLGYHFKNGFWAGIWNQHIRLYTPRQIKDVVGKAGFDVEDLEVQTQWSLPFSHYLINLGARVLATGVLPKKIHRQVNKFDKVNPNKRSLLVRVYFILAQFIDGFNEVNYTGETGTTIFIKARKSESYLIQDEHKKPES